MFVDFSRFFCVLVLLLNMDPSPVKYFCLKTISFYLPTGNYTVSILSFKNKKKIPQLQIKKGKKKKEIDDLFLSLAYISLSGNTLAFPFRASYLSFDNTIKQLSLSLSLPRKK
jgi:hypothetical protein